MKLVTLQKSTCRSDGDIELDASRIRADRQETPPGDGLETQNEVFGAVQEMNRDLLKLPAGEVAPLVL